MQDDEVARDSLDGSTLRTDQENQLDRVLVPVITQLVVLLPEAWFVGIVTGFFGSDPFGGILLLATAVSCAGACLSIAVFLAFARGPLSFFAGAATMLQLCYLIGAAILIVYALKHPSHGYPGL